MAVPRACSLAWFSHARDPATSPEEALVQFELTDDQRQIQALTREFADAEIAPHAADWDREHHFPRDLYGKLAELGLMGVCVPEEYGGAERRRLDDQRREAVDHERRARVDLSALRPHGRRHAGRKGGLRLRPRRRPRPCHA